jgi:DNA (cytosine-5)-methyltransferase 1
MGAADVGANHKRDRIWIVGKLADTSELFSNGSNNNARISLEQKTQSESGNSCRQEFMADTSGKGWESDKHVGNFDGREIRRSTCQQGENGGEQSLDDSLFSGLEGKNDQQESSRGIQQESSQRCNQVPNATSLGLSGQGQHEQPLNPAQGRERQTTELVYGRSSHFWAIEPNVGRVADGVAARVDRLKAIGNGQVPLCAATAWRLLNDTL